MFRKISLLLCIGFVVVCFAFPCFILPFGEYKVERIITEDQKFVVTYKFNMNKVTIHDGSIEEVYYYKVVDGQIVLSEDATFDDDDNFKIQIISMYEIGNGEKATNDIAKYVAIGVGAFAVILILVPSKKKKK